MSAILTFQITLGYLSLFVFTMLSIIVRTTSTRPMRFIPIILLAMSSIDTKDMLLIVARNWYWNFTILSNMRHTEFIHGITAIAKFLCISKAIGGTRNAVSAIVTLVRSITASYIGSTTLETRLSFWAITLVSIGRNNL